jgi:protein-disulfide isomerase
MKMTSTVWIVVGIILLSAAALFFASMSRTPQASVPFPAVRADDHVKGASSSPVVLVEYLDFECEGCGAYYPVVKQLESEFGDRVTFVARYFPLPSHRNSMPAALAAEAAGKQGKFWEMHDLMFENQKEWGEKQVETPEVFEGFAERLGLDMAKFRSDVTSPETRARVERDISEAKELGVNSTPSFFLNGERLRNPGSYEAMKALLESSL